MKTRPAALNYLLALWKLPNFVKGIIQQKINFNRIVGVFCFHFIHNLFSTMSVDSMDSKLFQCSWHGFNENRWCFFFQAWYPIRHRIVWFRMKSARDILVRLGRSSSLSICDVDNFHTERMRVIATDAPTMITITILSKYMNSYCIIQCSFCLSAMQGKNLQCQDYFAIITNIFIENKVNFNIYSDHRSNWTNNLSTHGLAAHENNAKVMHSNLMKKIIFDKAIIIRHM